MRSIKLLVVLAVGTLHFTVMSRRERLDQFVPDTKLGKGVLKERLFGAFLGIQPVCELRSVVGLDAFDGIGEFLDNVL